ncbi:MAG: glycosyltransferase family 2 protein [bacterium]
MLKNTIIAIMNLIFKKEKKLVMTLLVRNEIDIVRKNIEFHLKKGVNFIIATDNGSTDGTRDVLLEYEKRGILKLIDEPEQNYSQYKWVNRMGEIAIKEYKADIIFHCDADEFWFPSTGNLKDEIINSKENVLIVNLINILLEDKNGLESFPKNSIYSVIKPIPSIDLMTDSQNENLYMFQYLPKVMFKTNKGLLKVNQGNHSIFETEIKTKKVSQKKSEKIIIYHFPIRNKQQFLTKIINGGKSYEINNEFDDSIGFHWRRWYKNYKNGTIDSDYKKIILDNKTANQMITNGTISIFDINQIL